MTRTVTLEELAALNDEIASLVRAGVPLELGLHELAGDAPGALGEISNALSERMQQGAALDEALRAEERRIPAIYRSVVEAGLRAGRLPAALESMANFARELVELRRRIGLALLYPVIVMLLAYGLGLVFLVDVIHRFRETYETFFIPESGYLLAASWLADSVTEWWWVFPLMLALGVVWWGTTGRARVLSFGGQARVLAFIPGIGRISRYFQYANFAELLSLLVDQEVPFPEALRLAGEATADARLDEAARELAETVRTGQPAPWDRFCLPPPPSIWSWLLPYRWFTSLLAPRVVGFPPFLCYALTEGHRSPGLSRLLRHAAAIYRRRADNLANWFKIVFPLTSAVVIGGGVVLAYSLVVFGPLSAFWKDLVIE